MKIRPSVWAATSLLLASAFCVYRVSSQEAQEPGAAVDPNSLTSEQQKRLREESERNRPKREAFQKALENDQNTNYRAVANNGSKRAGLSLEELPENVREEAARIAQQYRTNIYPLLCQYLDTHHEMLPWTGHQVERLAPFIKDNGPNMGYKKGGAVWAISQHWRLDGTITARDVYSQNPPDAPHDVWALNANFMHKPLPNRKYGFIIYGWDDGKVTFDAWEDLYFGGRKNIAGKTGSPAPSGAAGIPPEAVHTLAKWQAQQLKELEASGAIKIDRSKPAKQG